MNNISKEEALEKQAERLFNLYAALWF
jgi:hypothetical protein